MPILILSYDAIPAGLFCIDQKSHNATEHLPRAADLLPTAWRISHAHALMQIDSRYPNKKILLFMVLGFKGSCKIK